MSIGYACLTSGVPYTNQKTCIQKNATPERLAEIISHNLMALETIIDYNITNHITLFRISSDLIPFGGSPVNTIPWWDIFAATFQRLKEKIEQAHIRISMHPGQYTVLNSPREDVVLRSIAELNYHAHVLELLGGLEKYKMVLHIGGIYQNKEQAIQRFITNYAKLTPYVKKHLVIENDDKSYSIEDVLQIGKTLQLPVIFDNLHHKLNPGSSLKNDWEWIEACKQTWTHKDGPQKIHYSQQNPKKQPGSHSETIDIQEFLNFYNRLNRTDIDIMLEVKDKNRSAIKCNLCTSFITIKELEQEWANYKYLILEKSPEDYQSIRTLLKDKSACPSLLFYQLIEHALAKEDSIGHFINAAQHVWGYFKDISTESEKSLFTKSIVELQEGKVSFSKTKNLLYKYTVKYSQNYLLYSYYFD